MFADGGHSKLGKSVMHILLLHLSAVVLIEQYEEYKPKKSIYAFNMYVYMGEVWCIWATRIIEYYSFLKINFCRENSFFTYSFEEQFPIYPATLLSKDFIYVAIYAYMFTVWELMVSVFSVFNLN